ncbi:hypothetical protein VCRA2119O48_540012 [Vibrio crassostreae]|nr:hypothetical protein VCRA2113O409_190009 [Vibrio crassostreae]CAK1890467.1 hypothetical protein VCRA2113O414_200010 [Vibrio crassostreae]CAK2425642.1 hypothetical protein VCRA2110O407_180010 [Vibrio crassostreae]CAK2452353.1 hypothetical protein VCRA2113O417_210083 [Vibrio crassostreae]CAK2515650.1 hypothetical protein VCRA2119O48_540012 [Vibrio crassostreae]
MSGEETFFEHQANPFGFLSSDLQMKKNSSFLMSFHKGGQ